MSDYILDLAAGLGRAARAVVCCALALVCSPCLTLCRTGLQGSTIKVLVSLFNIKLEETEDPTLAEEIATTTVDHITAGVEEIIGYRGTNFFKVPTPGRAMGADGVGWDLTGLDGM